MNLCRRQIVVCSVYRTLCCGLKQPLHSVSNDICRSNVAFVTRIMKPQCNYNMFSSIRYKSKKHQYDSDDEEVTIDDDTSLSKDSKVVKFHTTTMRADAILKSALAISRNKVEQAFYESKIRVNGKKILKKSAAVRLGDEVDVVKMISPQNPEHIYVSRVEILSIVPKEENISISIRRFKNLLIENYEIDPYKGSSESDS